MGKSCSEGTLASYNNLIDTNDKLQAVMTNLGSPCASFSNPNPSNAQVVSSPTIYTSIDKCYITAPAGVDRAVSTFDCSAVAGGKRRLCWCDHVAFTLNAGTFCAGE